MTDWGGSGYNIGMNTLDMTPRAFVEETTRARQAQYHWARRSVRQRVRLLRRFRHLLVEQAEPLALSVTQDIGRPVAELLGTDLLPTADACRYLERRAAGILRPRRVDTRSRPLWLFGESDRIYRRPHGLVGIIGTWNYPIFLNAVQMAHALTAGNAVLWKPSELVPVSSEFLYRLFLQAGFPEDLLICLPATREAGPLLAEADVDHVIFTGSADVGRKLAKRLGERLISSTLELSGCDTMIVLSDSDVSMAAKAAWFGCTLNKGQTCLAVRRVYVKQDRYTEFLDQLKPLAEQANSEPLVLEGQAKQAEQLVASALKDGAKLLLDGPAPKAESEPIRFRPTVVMDAKSSMAICQEASFAPIMAVMPFEDVGTMLSEQRDCPYGLGASIFTNNPKIANEISRYLEVGMIIVNDVIISTAHPATPFGGRRQSGWGVTQGAEGLLQMTVPQVVTNRFGSFRPHYDSTGESDLSRDQLVAGMLRLSHGGKWTQWFKGVRDMIRGGKNWKKKA